MPDCIEAGSMFKESTTNDSELKRGSVPTKLLNISKKHKSKNDEQEQSKSRHDDLSIEVAKTMDMYVYVHFIVYLN